MTTILSMDVHTVAVDAVTPYPGNARQGDIGAIATSLDAHGQYRPLVVQRSTSYVLCGNNTLAAARQLDWPEVAVQYVDVDDAQARKILLADNKTNDRASYDEQLLAEILVDVDDLTGTGYDETEVEDLLSSLEAEESEPTPLVSDPFAGAASTAGAPTSTEPSPPPEGAPEGNKNGDAEHAPHGEPTGTGGEAPAAPPAPAPVAEMILAFTPDDRTEAARLISDARAALGNDLKTTDIVLRALRALITATDARDTPQATVSVGELLNGAS